ncbi:MAG: ATPase [Bryobacterales bacterium]|nr:ATPase [Bryobacterales bacterium]
MSGLFLGVDGGQSSTTAVIGDQTGRVLGSGRGGPCNHVGKAEGRERFVTAISGSVGAACASAGLNAGSVRFRHAFFGLSGGPEQRREILETLVRADAISITHDGLVALAGAHGGEPGIITIAGTGSISFGRNAQGRQARAGGWGYIYGDEGGGFDIVRQAVRASLRAEEGWGPPTSLRARLLEATGEKLADGLLHQLYGSAYPRATVARMAPLVDEAAIEGDAVAREILSGAAQALASYTAAVRQQLFVPGEPVAIAGIGGVFGSRLLCETYRILVQLEEGCVLREPRYPPAVGALIEAWRAEGLKVRPVGVA